MSKLIYREPNGNWGVKGVPWAEIPYGLYGALYKLKDYEGACDSPRLVASFMDGNLGPVHYRLIDEEHNIWQCEECGYIAPFEADGPEENGFNCCPYCGKIIDGPDEEDDDEDQC